MSHNLNPFDFVPFPDKKPVIKTIGEWQKEGRLVTGWIEMQIMALTPLHIVGKQETRDGLEITQSHFYRRHGKAFIPAPSIRGMLRGFIEAVCNCWVSQINPYYLKETKKHQIGFQAVDSTEQLPEKKDIEKIDGDMQKNKKYSLPNGFCMPQVSAIAQQENMQVDLASFLFGYISPEGGGFHGRINIEDAEIETSLFDIKQYYIPDIRNTAFMGGSKPSASSWWYQKPYQIRLRPTKHGKAVDFVGVGYRGRKFYFHQDPQQAVKWYFDPRNWPNDSERPLYQLGMECLPAGKTTKPFRIYFEDLPEPLLRLLLFALSPGKRLRHKIGYGKAYGYGSIDIRVQGGALRGSGYNAHKIAYDSPSVLNEIHTALWNKEKLNSLGIGAYLEWTSMEAIARILWYEKNSDLLYTYPRFNLGYQVTDRSLTSLKRKKINNDLFKALEDMKDKPVSVEKEFFKCLNDRLRPLKVTREKNLIRQDTCCLSDGFLPSVNDRDLSKFLTDTQQNKINATTVLPVSNEEARQIAGKLADVGLRTALHFEVYRERASGYPIIQKRTLDTAEIIEGENT